MSRQLDLPIAPADVAESLPNGVSDSPEVAFQDNGILLGRRNLVRVKVLQQSLEVTLHAVARWLQIVISSCVITFLLFNIFPPPFSP